MVDTEHIPGENEKRLAESRDMGASFGTSADSARPSTSTSAVVYGSESLMQAKGHGSCTHGVQGGLRFGCDAKTADRICCFNRHYAEYSGSFLKTRWLEQARANGNEPMTYYDSVSGKALFVGPRGRSFKAFLRESKAHGWPSFRDDEVVWENVRILPNGEAVSVTGTHLGHNLPDRLGNRYCINLVSIAGRPEAG